MERHVNFINDHISDVIVNVNQRTYFIILLVQGFNWVQKIAGLNYYFFENVRGPFKPLSLSLFIHLVIVLVT